MANVEKFGKVTHDNLPQAIEHLIEMMSTQVENQSKESEQMLFIDNGDEIDIEQASVLLKKSKSTIYRYTCNNAIPYYKLGNSLRFRKSELTEWIKAHKIKTEEDILSETSIPFHLR
ncbi:helix-turn-helix domain-containing protein [Bacteroides sp.]|jgi:hypothetical protein|uniref:helix-turn-helix domain-containing protein n=1 Tax=Bacteroides sp. TaxID=29523 RepID=UPI00260E969C|nr:helix-turn-helix domain-containing protein [Bacteroides sp.]MDD3038108.1 helix-turn-helix domain-containing protein [Bacteroides sp.]